MQIKRWDQYSVEFTLRDQDWDLIDLTGSTVRFTVRPKNTRNDDDDENAIISKEITEHKDAENWVTEIRFLLEDTENPIWDYSYDMQVEIDDDIISTPSWVFSIVQDDTKTYNTL